MTDIGVYVLYVYRPGRRRLSGQEESLVVRVNKEGGIAISASLYIGFVVCIVYASLTFIVGLTFSSVETYIIVGSTFTIMQVLKDTEIVMQ